MSTAAWIIIAVAIVIVVIVAALVISRRRNRSHLQQRFGPEYDRTLENADSRRRAERELADRERERDKLDIRPLSDAARQRYADEWHDVQAQFVDRPESATAQADELVGRVMRERGYPVDEFDQRVDLVSVDYPQIVDDYRTAHTISERSAQGQANTEDLRTAMLRYRSLFDALLETERHTA